MARMSHKCSDLSPFADHQHFLILHSLTVLGTRKPQQKKIPFSQENPERVNLLFLGRNTSMNFFRGVSLGGAIPTAETPLVSLPAAAWGNSASLMSSSLPWIRTAVSVLVTPAVRRWVRAP